VNILKAYKILVLTNSYPVNAQLKSAVCPDSSKSGARVMVQLKSLRFMLVTKVLMLAVPNSQSSVIWASQALASGVALFSENVTVLNMVVSLLDIVPTANWMTLAGAVSADMLNMPIVKKSGVIFSSGWSGNDILPRNLLIFVAIFLPIMR
jgi:uncharacterized membrane protein YgdD (TMEM256/DUF423 family)